MFPRDPKKNRITDILNKMPRKDGGFRRFEENKALESKYLEAASEGCWYTMHKCLQQYPDVKEARNKNFLGAALIAVERNHLEVLVRLIEGNFLRTYERVQDICEKAATLGKLDFVKTLLIVAIPESDMDTDDAYRRILYASAAHGAASSGQLDIIKWVAMKTPLRDLVDEDGNTVLMKAHSNFRTVEWIIDHENVDVHHRNRYGETVLFLASLRQNDDDITKLLVTKGRANCEDVHGEGYTRYTIFFALLQRGRYNISKWMIQEGGQNINARSTDEDTPLIIAIKHNQLDLVQWMVVVGKADLSLSDRKGFSPLLCAFKQEKPFEIAQWLMTNGHGEANRIVDGKPAFFQAAEEWDMELLTTLLDVGGADVNEVDSHGASVWSAVNWNGLLNFKGMEMRVRLFIRAVSPRLDAPEEIVDKILAADKMLHSLLMDGMQLRRNLVGYKDRKKFNVMKDVLPPNDLRNLILEYDTMTTAKMWKRRSYPERLSVTVGI
jgi:ankyrin repeat protein